MKKLPLVCLLSCVWLAGAGPAAAHSSSTSYLVFDQPADDGSVPFRWLLGIRDISRTIYIDRDSDSVVTSAEVAVARPDIERAVLGQIALRRGDVPCVLRFDDVALDERPDSTFVSVAMRAQCPESGALSVSGPLFMEGDSTQRVMVTVVREEERLTGVMSPQEPRWAEPERPSAWGSFARFVREGVWHVAIGYDHIAFILLLLLPSVLRQVDGRWQGAERFGEVARDIVTIVTAFTIAHSITLALAVTGTVRLPTQPIEVAIAASIAVAGIINLLPRLSRTRLPLAFGFGLVHGFGFANALAEIETQGTGLLPLLAGFNIGVEIAQLGIVALVLPLIYSMRSTRWYAGGVVPLGSCALGAAGVVWLIQRL